jgi:hypothetical protein
MNLELGPIALRVFSADNWTSLELAFASNKNGGMARRETSIRGSFKSEHLLEMTATENTADSFTAPDGKVYYGRIQQTPTGVYSISSKEVYTASLYRDAVKNGLRRAEVATLETSVAA